MWILQLTMKLLRGLKFDQHGDAVKICCSKREIVILRLEVASLRIIMGKGVYPLITSLKSILLPYWADLLIRHLCIDYILVGSSLAHRMGEDESHCNKSELQYCESLTRFS
jgi:hypothetical protein